MAKATQKQVRAWCLGLLGRQNTNMTESDIEAALALTIPTLIAKFPADVFCAGSLDAVASTQRYWGEAGVTQALQTWANVNAVSTGLQLPPEAEVAPVSQEAKQWLANFYRRSDDKAAERSLGLIQEKSPEAFAYLMQNDHRAAGMAVWKHWTVPSRADLMADWDDEEAVRAMTRKIAGLLRSNSRFVDAMWKGTFKAFVQTIKINAPQHSGAVLDELRALASGERAAEPVHVPPEPGLFG